MSKHSNFQLELSGTAATLYVLDTVDSAAVNHLIDVCRELPVSIRTLRLDMSALGSLSAEALELPRGLLRFWRMSRIGEFRLSTTFLVATVSEAEPFRVPRMLSRADIPRNDSLMAAFL